MRARGGIGLVSYSEDKQWLNAKRVARENNLQNKWIDIIDYYNDVGGKHVQILCVIGEQKFRILNVLDDEKVLLLDKDKNPTTKTYQEVEESQKIFFYTEKSTVKTVELPHNKTYMGKNEVRIYI